MKHLYPVRRLAWLGLILPLMFGAVLHAEDQSEIDQIINVLLSYESHVNESNAEGLGALHTDDAILFPDRFDVFEGQQDITGFYAFAFSALTINLEFAIDPDNIVISDTTAYATTTSTGTRFIKDANQTVPEINRELWVFERIDGDWKIARYAFNKSQ
ncbi:MAG: nuclear transport factor 2 family protein [Pseudomonadota bacterium]